LDVNGTRFHLIKGKRDWERCLPPDAGDARLLSYDEKAQVLRFSSQLPLFVSARGGTPLDPRERGGAAVDPFGNWYWIGRDRRRIHWLPSGSLKSRVYWSQPRAARPAPSDEFVPVAPPDPPEVELRGLTVTSHHYLVVGNATQKGLFLFDLHAGGAPTLLRFPEGVPFSPFDMAAAPHGGVWILDRDNRAYWGLDRHFCVLTEGALPYVITPAEQEVFHVEGGAATIKPGRRFPRGFPLPRAQVRNPVAIEALPDGTVLILDSPAYLSPGARPPAPSLVHRYRMSRPEGAPLELKDADVSIVDELTGRVSKGFSLVGYDFALVPAGEKVSSDTLYVVEREGNQAIAFELNLRAVPPGATIQTDFWPMYFFGGRGLVAYRGEGFYDVASGDTPNERAVRWTPLQSIHEPRYPTRATLTTRNLDGRERGCVWHRLFVDACIPAETRVEVWTRAHDDAGMIASVEWRPEPAPYLRAAGAEIPYLDAFPQYAPDRTPENTGTWELLFQQARGRYLQLMLVLSGNGRTTPHLHTLRAYYPRLSYPKKYLPDVYLEDAGSAAFLERFLANEEGFFTEIEGKVNDVSLLFDPRGAPAEALDWLAGWVGIALDPLWAGLQLKRQPQVRRQLPRRRAAADRRRLFIRFARKLYERRGTPAGIHFALLLLLDPCLEVTLHRLKCAAVRPEEYPGLLDELRRAGLTAPDAHAGESELEDLLYEYALSPKRPSKVRVVERYRTRGGRRLQEGDASTGRETAEESSDSSAHRFSVLVPEALTSEEESMVRRIAELEKPAHTQFDVRRYWDFFRVGETRLGLDTMLGEEGRFEETVLGRSHLSEGYLHPSHPFDAAERVVSDRDRLGDMPPL
jgi:phage tail-like protein